MGDLPILSVPQSHALGIARFSGEETSSALTTVICLGLYPKHGVGTSGGQRGP